MHLTKVRCLVTAKVVNASEKFILKGLDTDLLHYNLRIYASLFRRNARRKFKARRSLVISTVVTSCISADIVVW